MESKLNLLLEGYKIVSISENLDSLQLLLQKDNDSKMLNYRSEFNHGPNGGYQCSSLYLGDEKVWDDVKGLNIALLNKNL